MSHVKLFFFPGKLLNLKCVQAPGFSSGDSNAFVKAPAFHLNFNQTRSEMLLAYNNYRGEGTIRSAAVAAASAASVCV